MSVRLSCGSATYLYCQQFRSISDKYFELNNKICFIDATIQKANNMYLYLLVSSDFEARQTVAVGWSADMTDAAENHEKRHVH